MSGNKPTRLGAHRVEFDFIVRAVNGYVDAGKDVAGYAAVRYRPLG